MPKTYQKHTVEKTVMRTEKNRRVGGYVKHKANALYTFYLIAEKYETNGDYSKEHQCLIGADNFITVIETKINGMYRVKAIMHCPSMQKWHHFTISGKNRSQCVARLLGACHMFWHPTLHIWMNAYDLCKPHITFQRQDGSKNPLPKNIAAIPTQKHIDLAANFKEKSRK